MERHVLLRSLAALGAAAALAAGLGAAADRGSAAPAGNDKIHGPDKVKAHVKHQVLVVEGTEGSDDIVVRLRAGDPSEVEVTTQDGFAGRHLRRERFDEILVEAGDGADTVRIDEVNGVFTDTEIATIKGEDGDDELFGGRGNESFDAGAGNDSVDGNQGADTALLGAGDDSFTWDPGDGSDVVEGQDGFDTLVFNGAAGPEQFDASANGSRLRFFRTQGNIVMDVDDTEKVALRALGGEDATTVNDLSATDTVEVAVDLAATIGGVTGDGAVDTVTVNGTTGDDQVDVAGSAGSAATTGLAAATNVVNADDGDLIAVNGLGGDDSLAAPALAAAPVKLALDGGDGDDTLAGGFGVDQLKGGSGDDSVDGNQGADVGLLGAGDDSFTWDPGDGSDVVEGQDGFDTLVFNGAGAAEQFDASANGSRLRFFRNLGNIVMDVDDTEKVDLRALGGADATTVNDLSATDTVEVAIDLAATIAGGTGDAAADTVTVNGTSAGDVAGIVGANGSAFVSGFSPFVRIAHAETTPPGDRLVVNGLVGDDLITAGGLQATAIQLTLNGGVDNDSLRGGAGDDVISGGLGVDLLIGGLGADQISCAGAGDTIVSDVLDTIAADCS